MLQMPLEKRGDGAATLIEIGTHGTVGNLVRKEIEYYNRLELGSGDHLNSEISLDPGKKHGGGGSNFWSGFGFLRVAWRRKKSNTGFLKDTFLPKVCMKVDVAKSRDKHRTNKIPGFSYQNL
ncbi:hypothetical protein CTI12_AA124850 [Artemisia annua]|uniref:Uncharacterized protein n=1 Tax=Artemisia annua TaxID=35608 RepID=A0A2U1PQH1_ARTAN|nr:hypothetical protein CTI12_AA124850 [Artemisia annua]